MAAWDKDLDEARPAWESDLDTPAPKKKPEPSAAAKVAASAPIQLAVGAADPVMGAIQRLGEPGRLRTHPLLALAASAMRPGVDATLADFNALSQEGQAGWLPRMAGNVLSPASLGMGKIGLPASLTGRTAVGVGAGATGGYIAPAATDEEARRNALVGGAVGGTLAPLIHIGGKAIESAANKIVRPVSDLFTEAGPLNIARRYVRQIIGEPNLPAVLNKTANAQELVPGSKPTVGEVVAGLPEGSPVNALQNITARTPGGPSADFGRRVADQADAINVAKVARGDESAVNYAKAFDIAKNPVVPDAQLDTLMKNPYFEDAVPAAMKLAKAKGISPQANLTEFLHDVKLGLDKKLANKGDAALDVASRRQVQSLKTDLVAWLAAKNPDYEIGRAAYSKASQAIDADLARREATTVLQPTNLAGGINIAEQTRPHSPNLLSRPAMALNFLLRKAGRDVEPKVDAELTRLLLSPAEFSAVISRMPSETRLGIEAWLRRSNALSAGIGASQGQK